MNEIRLKVAYDSQLDNNQDYFGAGHRQCNFTSHWMLVRFLKPELLESDFEKSWANFGDTTDHEAGTQCLATFGIKSEWRYDLSKRRIMDQLALGFPVPLGVAYKKSGHIVLATGYNEQGLLIHDPYGVRHGINDSYDVGANGAYDQYTWKTLDQILLDGGPSAGWGRIVEKVV